MGIEVRSIVTAAALKGSWLCPFCAQEAKSRHVCQCGAALYGKGEGRFVSRKDNRGMLSLKEQAEAQKKFNQSKSEK